MTGRANDERRRGVRAVASVLIAAAFALGVGIGAIRAQEDAACHPSYPSPCVPVGPATIPPCDRVPEFAFPVGEDDPLDLDHDDDGLGCEGVQETIWGDDLCEIAYCR